MRRPSQPSCEHEIVHPDRHPAGATIQSRLLGPMSACVGQPLTLCWRLERGPGAADGKDSVLHYEVAAQVGRRISCSEQGVEARGSAGRRHRHCSSHGSLQLHVLSCADATECQSPCRYQSAACPTPTWNFFTHCFAPPHTQKQGPGWSPGSARSGSVRLGGRPGSIATVEAGWVPLLPGSFAAPRLTIQGVHCQVRGEGGRQTWAWTVQGVAVGVNNGCAWSS